jgi:hypothetical protein
MMRATAVLLIGLSILAARAQEQPTLKDVTDDKEHWLFEFDMSSKKPLGTGDDIRAIHAACLAEARRDSHSAPILPVVVHWISPSQTVTRLTYVDAVRGARLFVLEKKDARWLIVHQYHIPKYPPKRGAAPQT